MEAVVSGNVKIVAQGGTEAAKSSIGEVGKDLATETVKSATASGATSTITGGIKETSAEVIKESTKNAATELAIGHAIEAFQANGQNAGLAALQIGRQIGKTFIPGENQEVIEETAESSR